MLIILSSVAAVVEVETSTPVVEIVVEELVVVEQDFLNM